MSEATKAAVAALKSRAARKKAPAAPTKLVPRPAVPGPGVSVAVKENPLLGISRDIVSRMPLGAEALLARRAIADWKGSASIRSAYGDVGSYFDVLVQLHGAGKLKIKEAFTMTEKLDGAEYGLELHKRWIAAGKPGTFTAFVQAEREKEAEEQREKAKTGGGR